MCDSSIPLPDFDFDEIEDFSVISTTQKFDLDANASNIVNAFGFKLLTENAIKSSPSSCVYAASTKVPYDCQMSNSQIIPANQYALKISSNKSRIYKEFENYNKLPESSNFVKSYDIFESENYIILQMELCFGGDIYGTKLDENAIWKLIHDIASALDTLHSEDLIHLDVSPSNILVKNNDFKLADFGNLIENGSFQLGDEGAGPYLAPEILAYPGTKETGFVHIWSAADIFSFGVVLIEAATGYFAPRGGTFLYDELRNGKLKLGQGIFKCDCSIDLISLVNQMINPNPLLRPTAGQIMQHPLVKRFDI